MSSSSSSSSSSHSSEDVEDESHGSVLESGEEEGDFLLFDGVRQESSLMEESDSEEETEDDLCASAQVRRSKRAKGIAIASSKGNPRSSKRKKKPGIIYLSSIPTGFNVSRTTAYFSKLGQVGRVFLQPNPRDKNKYKSFTEGWIEFTSKSVARSVAESLNLSAVGGRKRSKAAELLWNVKYLPRFKWSHLTERSNYERAVHTQRMRSEVSLAKKEGDFFKASLSKRRKEEEDDSYDFFLKETESTVLSRRKRANAAASGSPGPSKRPKRETASEVSKKGKKGKGKSSNLRRSEFLKNVFSEAPE